LAPRPCVDALRHQVFLGHHEHRRSSHRARRLRGIARQHAAAHEGAQEQAQGSTLKFGVSLQKMAQPLRHREDPFPQRQVGKT
jgi:hypothetical protein